MKKKLLSACMVCALGTGMIAGCGSDDAGKDSINVKDDSVKPYYEVTGDEKDKDIAVSWFLIGGSDEYYQHYWEEMKGLQVIQQVTGVNIDFQVKIGYDDYLPMFTAKSYPDIITANNLSKYPGRMGGMYEDGVSISLNDYLDEWMPNFSKILEEYPTIARDLRMDDGAYTFVSTLYDMGNADDRTAASKFGLAVRKDWLDSLGMSVPTNMDEWFEALLAFKQDDPNGDGQQNEEPVCMASSAWKYFLPAYGIDDDPSIQVNEDGIETVVYGFMTESYKEYLAEMKKWNDEGLIYNMFENVSLEKRQERVLGNFAGAWKGEAHMFDEQNTDSYINKLREVVPEAEFAACPWPKTADGYQWCYSDINSFASDSTVITSLAKERGTDKAAAYLIDYMLGENGSKLLTWGIEGESYEIVNGEKQLMEDMDEMVQFYDKEIPKKYTYADPLAVMLPQFGEISSYILSNQPEEYVNACQTWSQGDTRYKMVAACQLSVEQQQEVENIEGNFKSYISKMRKRFIQGVAPLTEYDTYIAQVKEMGGDKYNEIWTQAYENYKKR